MEGSTDLAAKHISGVELASRALEHDARGWSAKLPNPHGQRCQPSLRQRQAEQELVSSAGSAGEVGLWEPGDVGTKRAVSRGHRVKALDAVVQPIEGECPVCGEHRS